MKITCERDTLNAAMRVVSGKLKAASDIPILHHVLMEAEGQSLKLTGHNLDCCATTTVASEVDEAGAVAIPADRLARMIAGVAAGARVTISADDKTAKVRAGRSTYQFALLPATDFPAVMEPINPTSFMLSAKEVDTLFKSPAACISSEETRFYLRGICLQHRKKMLVACATDGHRLLETQVKVETAPFENVIVPEFACAAIALLAKDGDVTIEISKDLIAVTAGSSRFVSKLIAGTFPDYSRVIPPPAPTITVDAAALDAALSRLLAACDPEKTKAVKLSWGDNAESITATLTSDVATGQDEIECDSSEIKAGEIGAQVEFLRSLIDAADSDVIRMHMTDPGTPIRIEVPNRDGFVAVCMPYRI